MAVELVTGYANEAHITSADDGQRNAGTFGAGKYVLGTGSQLECTVQSATAVVIGTGDALFEGRHVAVHDPETVSIDNGAQGMNRRDLVCIHYTKDGDTGIEEAALEVLKGTATSGTPSDPTIPSGSILQGSLSAWFALWRIPITGLTIGTPAKMFGTVMPTLYTAGTGSVAASRVTGTLPVSHGGTGATSASANRVFASPNGASGAPTFRALVADDVPNLDAAKITTGTLGTARVPDLSAAKITSGTLAAARVPSLDASKIGSGTLALARGGTAANNSSVAANRVFASPNGSSGAASWRAIVADDLPSLPASKIGSGVLAVARGGTGAATASANRVLASPNGSSGAPSFRALVAADIPDIGAGKVTSGTFDAARIPNLDASKITAGTLAAARVPSLDASKIGSGTLPAARGGTGKTSLNAAANAFVNALPQGDTRPNDDSYMVVESASDAGVFLRKKASAVWSYIKSKADAVYAAVSHTHAASAITSGQLGVARMPYYQILSSAGSGNLTLTETAANFTYAEVFYRTNDSINGSVKVYSPNGKTFCMQSIYIDAAANMFVKTKHMQFDGTNVKQVGYAGHMTLHDDTEPAYTPTASEFTVYRIIGYK